MKLLITMPAIITLNLIAEPMEKPIPGKAINKPCKDEYCEFQRELLNTWKETSKNIKPNTRFEITFSDEQAQIDIAKAELQKIYLKFRQQGKFKKNTEIKSKITKEDIN